MKNLIVLVVDDNADMRSKHISCLDYFEQIDSIIQAENVSQAVEMYNLHKPHLILLDVEMPDGTGFDFLEKISNNRANVIFITSFQDYAIQAFKFSAIDYLVKPYEDKELITAVEKAISRTKQENEEDKIQTLLHNLQSKTERNKKIVLNTSSAIHVVNTKDIIRIEADGNYSLVYFNKDKKVMLSKRILEYEEMLQPFLFIRVHKSHLINIAHLDFYNKRQGVVVMSNGDEVGVSSRNRDRIVKRINEAITQIN